jgi:hypothetical protein
MVFNFNYVTLYIQKEQIACMPRENLPDILLLFGHWFSYWPKMILQTCTKTNLQKYFKCCLEKMVFFTIIYTLYIQKSQIAGPKSDHVTRKSLGHITLDRALVLILSTDDPPNLYKIESLKVVGSRILCCCYFSKINTLKLYRERTNRRTKKWPCHAKISRIYCWG